MHKAHDPHRLSVALHSAIVEGSWNPTDWGRTLLRHLDSALSIASGDADQNLYRTIVCEVAVSDLLVHLHGEIADALIPATVLDVALTQTAPARSCEPAPEMPRLAMAA